VTSTTDPVSEPEVPSGAGTAPVADGHAGRDAMGRVRRIGRRWRSALLRPDDSSRVRHVADVGRLLLGIVGLVLSVALMATRPDGDAPTEDATVAIVGWAGSVMHRAGFGLALALVALVIVLTRNVRLLLAALTAGAAGWLVGAAVPVVVQASERTVPGYDTLPVLIIDLTVAVAVMSSAYLATPARRLLSAFTIIGVVGVVADHTTLPLDAVASACAGLVGAAIVRLALGAPAGEPEVDEVVDAAGRLGVALTHLEADPARSFGAAIYRGTMASDDGGDPQGVVVEVRGREASEYRFLARLWHALRYRGGGDGWRPSRRAQIEHEAFALLLADRAHVVVPRLVASGVAGDADDALLVTEVADGPTLDALSDDEWTDELLDAAWRTVERLGRARLAHGALDAGRLWRTPDGAIGVDGWSGANTSATDTQLAQDVAAVLAMTDAVVGPERAAAAAVRALGAERVGAALPVCQPAVLPRATRHALGKEDAKLTKLRAAVVAATGTEEPELLELRRVTTTDLLMIVGTLFGFWLIVGQFTQMGDIGALLTGANWVWLVTTLFVIQFSYLTMATSLRAVVPQPLPFGPVVALQYGNTFTGLVGGTVAITATNIRFFQRAGIAPSVAVTCGVVNSLAGGLVQTLIILCSLPVILSQLSTENLGGGGEGKTILIIILVVGALLGIVFALPRFRRIVLAKLKPQVALVRGTLSDLFSRPKRVFTLMAAAAATQLIQAITLSVALLAFGQHLSIWTLLLINTVAALFGGLAPVPGGMGVIEGAIIAGLTAAGIPQPQAAAATMAYRLVSAYLPPIWGWPTLTGLRHRGYL